MKFVLFSYNDVLHFGPGVALRFMVIIDKGINLSLHSDTKEIYDG